MMRPWNNHPILDCGEKLGSIPSEVFCLQPHPYVVLGAPYGDCINPFCLRRGVLIRLLRVQRKLQKMRPGLRLAIFDAWRPLSVQKFMVEYSISKEVASKGLLPGESCDFDASYREIVANVAKFWASPSEDPLNPPPHSTGGALDLTLATIDGNPLEMGGQIDEISNVSKPDHYCELARTSRDSEAYVWHQHRLILREVMEYGGFVQHPNEWWHFSYGDQLWAWSTNTNAALYGAVNDSERNSNIA